MMSPGVGAPAPPGVPGSGECQLLYMYLPDQVQCIQW